MKITEHQLDKFLTYTKKYFPFLTQTDFLEIVQKYLKDTFTILKEDAKSKTLHGKGEKMMNQIMRIIVDSFNIKDVYVEFVFEDPILKNVSSEVEMQGIFCARIKYKPSYFYACPSPAIIIAEAAHELAHLIQAYSGFPVYNPKDKIESEIYTDFLAIYVGLFRFIMSTQVAIEEQGFDAKLGFLSSEDYQCMYDYLNAHHKDGETYLEEIVEAIVESANEKMKAIKAFSLINNDIAESFENKAEGLYVESLYVSSLLLFSCVGKIPNFDKEYLEPAYHYAFPFYIKKCFPKTKKTEEDIYDYIKKIKKEYFSITQDYVTDTNYKNILSVVIPKKELKNISFFDLTRFYYYEKTFLNLLGLEEWSSTSLQDVNNLMFISYIKNLIKLNEYDANLLKKLIDSSKRPIVDD